MIIENHMVMRDHSYENEMSGQYWTEETETCPMCQGEQWKAHICCGVKPSIEDDECVVCGKPLTWERCPVCLGKGEITRR